ncbi:MAG: alternative ribosome rescue aminoacyl-tRNA hydrolase ArfB [Micromonosporaceae bacterium]
MTASVTIPRAELEWRFSRASGPGGQSVNTADSRVELRFDLAGSASVPAHLKARALARLAPRLIDGALVVTASEHRSQLDNRRAAAARLVALLTEGFAPPARTRRATRPSRAVVRARVEAKRRHGRLKRERRNLDE